MSKLLIVTSQRSWAEHLVNAKAELGFDEVVISDYSQAFQTFLTGFPTHVLVGEYYEMVVSSKELDGKKLWDGIRGFSRGERFVRCGFMAYNYEDFIRLPFTLSELHQKMFP